tara:strand:- start:219235 stop:219492 length:258 start_codon:yes stop_codon:yes gene_type:complete
MNILDFQSFIEMRQKSFGRTDLMPAVSITTKNNSTDQTGDLTKTFDETLSAKTECPEIGRIATISYTDPKTGAQRSKDVRIVKMP